MSNSKIDVAAIMKQAAESFQSVETTSQVFGPGQHTARLVKAAVAHSFMNYDGSEKDKEYEWSIPTPLVMVTFADGDRAIVHRYHLLGYKRYDNLTPKEKESGDYEPSEDGFALKDGERIVDQENTAACQRILSGLFNAVGLKPGSGLDDLDALVQAGEAECVITVKETTSTTGKTYNEVKSVRKVQIQAPVTG